MASSAWIVCLRMSRATSAVVRSKYERLGWQFGIAVLEVEVLHVGRRVEREALLASSLEVALEDLPWVTLERGAVQVGDVAEHARRGRILDAPGQQLEAVRIGHGEDVALLHPAEAVDRRAVELHPFLEGRLELGGRSLDGLELAEHVAEPQPDVPDAPFLDCA
jgi:hypothetical protein